MSDQDPSVSVSAVVDDLEAEFAALAAREARAALSDEEAARARRIAELEEKRAALAAQEKAKRSLVGAAQEKEARKAAGSKYLVKYVDLGALLPDADPETLPGKGVLVVRSPTPDAWAQWSREHGANDRPLEDISVDLVLASLVYPASGPDSGAEGVRLRGFFETYKGAAISVGNEVTRLGGIRVKQAKRGRADS